MKFKKLLEKRAADQAEMELLVNKAEGEERALTEEEQNRFNELESEIRAIDATIEAGQRARALDVTEKQDVEERAEVTENTESVEEAEVRAFAEYIRGRVSGETRGSDVDITTGNSGDIIPTTIARRIIETVKEISPVFELSEHYNVKGNLEIPYYDEGTTEITAAYANEFEELASTAGAFKTVSLQSYLSGALTKVSKSLVNNSDFDLVSFVVRKMAEAFAKFFEGEILNPSDATNKAKGITELPAAQQVTQATNGIITADELIDVQERVNDVYQQNAIWVMTKATRTAVRKLKDGEGRYLLEKDATARWGYTLFGKPVYTTEQLAELNANAKFAIAYGDWTGIASKVSEALEIEVLRERFATQHVVGVVGWSETDFRVQNAQKLAVLKTHSA